MMDLLQHKAEVHSKSEVEIQSESVSVIEVELESRHTKQDETDKSKCSKCNDVLTEKNILQNHKDSNMCNFCIITSLKSKWLGPT